MLPLESITTIRALKISIYHFFSKWISYEISIEIVNWHSNMKRTAACSSIQKFDKDCDVIFMFKKVIEHRFSSRGGFPVMAETTRNHIFSKEISQVIIAAMVLAPNFY